jgi:hypothetical protein
MTHLEPHLSGSGITSDDLGCPTSNGVDSGVLANESMMARQRMDSRNENWWRHIVSRS